MNMTPILREAIRRVRESDDFHLLDCLELLDRRNAGEEGALATMRWCGQTLLGYGDAESLDDADCDCEACDGDGELEAEGNNGRTYYVMCPECHGDCVVASTDARAIVPPAERLTWRNLNGKPVKLEMPATGIVPKFYDFHQVADIIAREKAALAKAEAVAA